MPAPGDLISGRYRLLRLMGEGGMGSVWAAHNEAIDREVAIKTMLPEVARDPANLQRFFNEARICGSIRHPGIVDVLDLGKSEDGAPYLVMELLHGAPLSRVLDACGMLRPGEILPIVRDVARTVALAHAKSVVHRDLKPANLFLHRLETSEVVAKVLDFGISKVVGDKDAVRATRTGTLVGSPAYMSPEQATGKSDLGPSSDLYALGVILYEGLSGELPYEGDNYNAIIVAIASGRLRPLEALVPDLPPGVLEVVQACLRSDPKDRVASASELADRIDALLPSLDPGRSRGELLGIAMRTKTREFVRKNPDVPGTELAQTEPLQGFGKEAPVSAVAASVVGPPASLSPASVAEPPAGRGSLPSVPEGASPRETGSIITLSTSLQPSRSRSKVWLGAALAAGTVLLGGLGLRSLVTGDAGAEARSAPTAEPTPAAPPEASVVPVLGATAEPQATARPEASAAPLASAEASAEATAEPSSKAGEVKAPEVKPKALGTPPPRPRDPKPRPTAKPTPKPTGPAPSSTGSKSGAWSYE